MKSMVLALGAILITSVSTTTWAGERGHHRHDQHRHYRQHHHHAYRPSHKHNHGAYLAGGLVLGAVINELSRPRDAYVKETVYVTRAHYENPSAMRELRLDGDGRCYEVENRGDRRLLLEVPRSACY
jgi:hypothetical protein